jgi:hypothetical protein
MLLLHSNAFRLSPAALAVYQGLTGKAVDASASHPEADEKNVRVKREKGKQKPGSVKLEMTYNKICRQQDLREKREKGRRLKTMKCNRIKDLQCNFTENTLCAISAKSRIVLKKNMVHPGEAYFTMCAV